MDELPALTDLGNLPFTAFSATMAYRLLGPTATYLGGKGRELTEKAVTNIERIFQNAYKKLGDDLKSPGQVPPRVLRGIVQEGAYTEDEIAAEYLGGILASSRSQGKRDDRGVAMNALIARLSVYQLRTHYITYHAIKQLFNGTTHLLSDIPRFDGVSMPFITYALSMEFLENEFERAESREVENPFPGLQAILGHTFYGLHNEGLIGDFEYGNLKHDNIIVCPSELGIELFLWAHGKGNISHHEFLSPSHEFEINDSVPLYIDDVPITPDDGTEAKKFVNGFGYSGPAQAMVCKYPCVWTKP